MEKGIDLRTTIDLELPYLDFNLKWLKMAKNDSKTGLKAVDELDI